MREIITTSVEIVGLALVTFGLWLIFQPAAFIFAGGAIVGFSAWKNK